MAAPPSRIWCTPAAFRGQPTGGRDRRSFAILAASAAPAEGLRWHARAPGLVALARDAAGAIVAVQHIRLAPDGTNASDGRLVKVTVGSGQGAAVRLPGDPAGPLVLAEGPEIGLSAWAAAGYETWVTLGSVTRADPPPGRVVVVCRDDDAIPGIIARDAAALREAGREDDARRLISKMEEWRSSNGKLTEAMERWRGIACRVAKATPWRTSRGDSSDMNDAMRAHGPAYLASRIGRALPADRGTL